LGIFIVKSRYFKCSLDYAKRSFYRATNSIFGKIGRIASEQVTLQLLYSKCVPVLLWSRSLSFEHFWLQISRLCHWQVLYEAIQNYKYSKILPNTVWMSIIYQVSLFRVVLIRS